MIEVIRHTGIFHAWDNPGFDNDELRRMWERGGMKELCVRLRNYERRKNILMASQKLLMANAVYPNIDRLAITSQTSTPTDAETSYSGTLYTTQAAEEFTRSGNVNPYTVGWNILSDSANGTWGSFILITNSGAMINRALAGVTKASGTAKLVIFTGSVD
jgi:hypothetical protein